MDTLHDRLTELADDAPTGGAPAAELWARGKRVHRLRSAALAATVVVVCAVGAGIGLRLADGGDHRSDPVPAAPVGVVFPIEFPVGVELPDLGDAPGPLAAIWVTPPVAGGAPEAVGIVAETGMFGTLRIDVSDSHDDEVFDAGVALSPDGRWVAYQTPAGELVARDLVSGESSSPVPEIETRAGYMWSDATHLFGHVAGGSDVDAWVWEPGTAPRLFNQLTYGTDHNIWPHGVGRDVRVAIQGGGPGSCTAPTLENDEQAPDGRWEVAELCDVLGIAETVILLGHGNSLRLPWTDRNDGNGKVIAVSMRGQRMSYNGRPVPPVVITSSAPERVALATDLIADLLLDPDAGAP